MSEAPKNGYATRAQVLLWGISGGFAVITVMGAIMWTLLIRISDAATTRFDKIESRVQFLERDHAHP